MRKAPEIGARVRYVGASTVFNGTVGTVESLYKMRHPIYADDDEENGEIIGQGPVRPETEWKATVRVDAKPKGWPYGDTDKFCPTVSDLEPA